MKIIIKYTKKSLKFLKTNQKLNKSKCDSLVQLALKRIYLNEVSAVDLKKIVGVEETYRIRVGKYRIIFSIDDNGEVVVALVETIASRGDVYKGL